MTVRIKPGNVTGERTSRVQIQSTDTAAPVLELSFDWVVKNPLHADASELKWLDLKPGEDPSRDVPIFVENMSLCPQCRIEATPGSSQVTSVFQRHGASDSSHDSPPAPTDEPVGELGIRIRALDDTEVHREMVTVALRCGDETRATLGIPISWHVSPVLVVAPERLSLGACQANGRFTRKVIVRSSRGRPFRLLEVNCSDAGVLVASRFDLESDHAHILELDLAVPDVDGAWRTPLELKTDHPDAELVTLPVSALVTRLTRTAEESPPLRAVDK
jgi:hypothetical protein